MVYLSPQTFLILGLIRAPEQEFFSSQLIRAPEKVQLWYRINNLFFPAGQGRLADSFVVPHQHISLLLSWPGPFSTIVVPHQQTSLLPSWSGPLSRSNCGTTSANLSSPQLVKAPEKFQLSPPPLFEDTLGLPLVSDWVSRLATFCCRMLGLGC